MFIENVGQFDERARCQVRGANRTIWLAEDSIWVTMLEKPSSPALLLPGLGAGPGVRAAPSRPPQAQFRGRQPPPEDNQTLASLGHLFGQNRLH
jgi:hypothetical protein